MRSGLVDANTLEEEEEDGNVDYSEWDYLHNPVHKYK